MFHIFKIVSYEGKHILLTYDLDPVLNHSLIMEKLWSMQILTQSVTQKVKKLSVEPATKHLKPFDFLSFFIFFSFYLARDTTYENVEI